MYIFKHNDIIFVSYLIYQDKLRMQPYLGYHRVYSFYKLKIILTQDSWKILKSFWFVFLVQTEFK